MAVSNVDVLTNGAFQLESTSVDAAAELLVRQISANREGTDQVMDERALESCGSDDAEGHVPQRDLAHVRGRPGDGSPSGIEGARYRLCSQTPMPATVSPWIASVRFDIQGPKFMK